MVKWCSISVSGMFGNTFKQFQCHKLHFMSLLIKLGKIYWDSRDLSAAIFKSPIAATRGLGELVSRQKWIPHTQIRLEQPLIHNCTILQCALHIIELKLTLYREFFDCWNYHIIWQSITKLFFNTWDIDSFSAGQKQNYQPLQNPRN